MKKTFAIGFCVLMLSSLLLLGVGMVTAVNPAYPTTIYQGKGTSTFDGYWTTRH